MGNNKADNCWNEKNAVCFHLSAARYVEVDLPDQFKLAKLLVTNFVSNVKLMTCLTCLAYYLPSLQVVVEPSLKRSG